MASLTNGSSGDPGHAEESVQVISGDKEYNDAVGRWSQSVEVRGLGLDYHVVSVFGSQSTGKSTLLNALFGTDFATMDNATRQQTTKGIWLARARESNVLVMDVEGTDGRERGDDQDFERKAALFSLAVSEVLVVNMWETQVGLFHGANMSLLKTVFDVNLQIFSSSNRARSCLLFVIRDHLGTTPLDNLAATITQDLEKMWTGLAKPEGLEDAKLGDFFDLDFFGLNHKVLAPEKFDAGVAALKDKFYGGSVFRQAYARAVPIDGFSAYASQIWQVILENKDLDLPTQQELLAQYRCDEIAAEAVRAYEAHRPALQAFSGASGELGGLMRAALSAAVGLFEEQGSRYQKSVYERKRSELKEKIEADLYLAYRAHLDSLRKSAMRNFADAAGKAVDDEDADFMSIVQKVEDEGVSEFTRQAEAARISDGWSTEKDVQELRTSFDTLRRELESSALAKKELSLVESAGRSFTSAIGRSLESPSTDVWKDVLRRSDKVLNEAIIALDKRATGLGRSTDELTDLHDGLTTKLANAFLQRVRDELSPRVLVPRLRLVFEERFKYDDAGVPIVWQRSAEIEDRFKPARDAVLALVPRLAVLEIDADQAATSPLAKALQANSPVKTLDEEDELQVSTSVKRFADTAYLEAKRSTISSVSHIPVWFYGLLILLGWNEFMAVLRSPMTFFSVIFCGLVAYAIYILNLAGPVEQVARAMAKTTVDVAKEKLRVALEIGTEAAAAATSTATAPPRSRGQNRSRSQADGESIELKDL